MKVSGTFILHCISHTGLNTHAPGMYTGEVIRKIILGVAILVMLAVSAVFAAATYNGRLEPPTLTANFVDVQQVRRITKFRSCAGHTTTPKDGRETKRSMKHYFILHPEYHQENTVKIYAPYDGQIALLFGNEEIWVAPERGFVPSVLPINQWMFSLTHVKPAEGLKRGDKVRAGELIGYGTFSVSEPGSPSFDAVYGKMSVPPKKIDNWSSPFGGLDSVFNHMSPALLAQYEQRGITRQNIILTKEQRDADPCAYRDGGPYFEPKNGSNESVELK